MCEHPAGGLVIHPPPQPPIDTGWAWDGCCYYRVGLGWLLLLPRGLRMVVLTTGWAWDGCCYKRVGLGRLLLLLAGIGMVAQANETTQRGQITSRWA